MGVASSAPLTSNTTLPQRAAVVRTTIILLQEIANRNAKKMRHCSGLEAVIVKLTSIALRGSALFALLLATTTAQTACCVTTGG